MIRRAAPADVPAIVRLWREMWDLNASLDARFAAGPMAQRTLRALVEGHLESDRSCVLVAEEDGALVGYGLGAILENPPITEHPAFGYVSDLAVTAAARRRGIGARLIEALHEFFRSRGLAAVEVQVSVANAGARSFWRRQGYSDFVERLQRRL